MASIHKKDNGTWCVRYRQDGKNRSKTGFKTMKEAKQWLWQQEHQDSFIPKITYDDLVKEYLDYKKCSVRHSTYITAVNALSKWHFKKPIDKITSLEIEKQFYDIPFKYSTKKNYLSNLITLFKYAKRKYSITPPTDNVTVRDVDMDIAERLVISTDDLYKLIDAETDPKYKLFYKTLYLSGMRFGEAAALTWDDVTDDYINVNKSVSKNGVVSPPKNKASIRKIILPKELLKEIKDSKKDAYYGSPLVFSSSVGTYLICFHFDKRLQRLCKKIGLPKYSAHSFRHSCASYLISQGLPNTAVAKHLGHSSPATTMKAYAHMMPSDDEIKLQLLLNILRKSNT